MDQQQHSTEDLAAPWEAAIVYPDGRQPVLLTPPDGVPHAEAQAIAATYAETAESEGGEVTTASLRGYPAAEIVEFVLRAAEVELKRRTGRTFKLALFGGILRAYRDDGYHAAVEVRPVPDPLQPTRILALQTFSTEERLQRWIEHRVGEAVDALELGHQAEAA